MSVLVDSNILLRLRQTDNPLCPICGNALRRLLDQRRRVHFCTQAAIEYWVVATRPRDVNGLGMSPAAAEAGLRYFDRLLLWLPEPADVGLRWRSIVNQYGVLGKQAHDARLVAFMLAHGLTHLLTLNTPDFARYTGITALHPNDVK